jgi:hypothetical protein
MHAYPFVKIRQPANKPTMEIRGRRSVGHANNFWENASTLTFSFMQDLPDELKYRVELGIRQWEPFVSLAFELVENGAGQIRIALGGNESYSAIGTTALHVDPDEPTLVVGAEPENPHFEPSLLHEFGHALGFHHAHLHPAANIPWNEEAVYKYFVDEQGWDEEEVDSNIFDDAPEHFFSGEYDKDSIMHYAIPNFLTLNNFEVGYNTKLSMGDKLLARRAYPGINYREIHN